MLEWQHKHTQTST